MRRDSLKGSLTEWCRHCGYEPAPHHRKLIELLEAVEAGEVELAVIEMPPGAAKSTYVNFLFPAWYLARHPDHNLLTASHNVELATRWGRKTRNLVSSHGADIGLTLSGDSSAAYRWATTETGEYYAVGVDVGIAGFRADIGIIDDPFGSREDAASSQIRQKRWTWYLDDFSSRLKPGARRVIMHTRWHDDDIAGRVKRQMHQLQRPFVELTIPAEAREHDILGRAPGEMLWDDPGGYDYASFLRRRKEESDTRTWASLYQQNPVPDEGDYFHADWLMPIAPGLVPAKDALRVFGGSDYAVTADGGDYTVHAVVGLDYDNKPYLLDLWRHRTSSDAWIAAWCDIVKLWRPIGWAEEMGQIVSGVGPFLEREARRTGAFVAREQFPTRGDKGVRAQSFRGLIASGGLRYREDAPWRSDMEAELLRFPAGVHDDIVDALGLVGQLINRMLPLTPPKPETPQVKSGYRHVGASRSNPHSIGVL
jgi:predicted phage terminase large subunit-like protein